MSTPKRLSALFIFSVMMLFSTSSMAAIFSYITESKLVGSKGADYTFIIQRWDPESPGTLNPCYGWKRCYITINHRHEADGSGGTATKRILSNAQNYRTMEELRQAVLAKLALPYGPNKAVHRGVDPSLLQECVGLFYQEESSGIAKSGRLLPGSSCGIAPPPVGACQIIDGSVNLDYGEINENELNNARRSKNINITCNKDMSVKVIATGMVSDRIPLRSDNSLYANLYLGTLNGGEYPGEDGTIIFVPKGRATSVSVSSVLRTNGRVEAGFFSGSGALILTLP
ncbi:adhesin [Proteus terrae]|uniref:MrpH family fimbial adhesin n=1 Tax=Proteus TaxID=583 RepID=UPI0020345F43|nr:adhesin [Proteus sp. FZP2095]MCM2367784.1 adhesin [Proteus sp. FZP2095]